MNTPIRKDGNVVYLFGPLPEDVLEAKRGEEVPPPDPAPVHPLDGYLAHLEDNDLLTAKEMAVLVAVLAPLRAHFEGLSTVTQVQEELRPKGMTVDKLRLAEREEWNNKSWPWFDIDAALSSFNGASEQLAKEVTFLNDAVRQAKLTCVDHDLENAEVFFWLILRMYRTHALLLNENLEELAAKVAPAVPAEDLNTLTRDADWFLNETAPLVAHDEPDDTPTPPRRGLLSKLWPGNRRKR